MVTAGHGTAVPWPWQTDLPEDKEMIIDWAYLRKG
jgi:hypothetical protein